MTVTSLAGGFNVLAGPYVGAGLTGTTLDAANESVAMIGQIMTSDGAAHTLDNTGSIGWLTGGVTFANVGTALVVGVAALDGTVGPPGRAVNVADVITPSVFASLTGGGGGVTASAWQTTAMTTGSLSIGPGSGMLAVFMQMTARGGADSVVQQCTSVGNNLSEYATSFTGGAYATVGGGPNAIITFGDGAIGWFYGFQPVLTAGGQNFNTSTSPNEYGQLMQFPFPVAVRGAEVHINQNSSGGDFSIVLYSDPLGSPVAQRTTAFDQNNLFRTTATGMACLFDTPYTVPANTPFVIAVKPTTTTSVQMLKRTIASATHRVMDPWGTNGYGVSRSSGAFANLGSSLTHMLIYPAFSGFDNGAGGSGMLYMPGMDGGMN